jgi:hypothetical protein
MDSEPRKEGHVDVLTDQVEFLEEQIMHITKTSKDILELILQLQPEVEKRRGVEQGVVQEAQLTSVYSESVVPGVPDIYSQPVQPSWMYVKPSPLMEFSGDRMHGQAFLNSCKLYSHLASHQFDCDDTRIVWAFSYMKTGCAALFVDHVLREEARTTWKRFSMWNAFRTTFIEEFLPKNEVQHALTWLETTLYHQGERSMDEYIDEFWDLIDQAGYRKGLAIVMKICKGL